MSYRVNAGFGLPRLSVPVLGRTRHKPRGEPDVWSEAIPQASDDSKTFSWMGHIYLAPVTLFAFVVVPAALAPRAFSALLAFAGVVSAPVAFATTGLVAILLIVAATRRGDTTQLELDADGILIRNAASTTDFIPYGDVQDVQTYLDEAIGSGTWTGLVLEVADARTLTLELGRDTHVVGQTICRHTGLVARHLRCVWSADIGA